MAAESILTQVSHVKHRKLIANMKKMCDAYISLAYLAPDNGASKLCLLKLIVAHLTLMVSMSH